MTLPRRIINTEWKGWTWVIPGSSDSGCGRSVVQTEEINLQKYS